MVSTPSLDLVLAGTGRTGSEPVLCVWQAYLTGRISASGDVKKLMFFDKISSRGHKQGSMFSI